MMAGDLGEDYPGPSPTVGITWMEVIQCLPEFPRVRLSPGCPQWTLA